MELDMVVVGGTIIDGTGRGRYRGDVGIRDGSIAALGDIRGRAAETIDASGSVVTPGFVDIHTHYDAQLMWDRTLSCSPWHGVTTVVIGSCGFGIAPTRPSDRDTVMRTLEKVEGMSYQALRSGLGPEWPFVSFPDYLDAIDDRGVAINVASYIGHTPLRLFVMGDEASERAATATEIEDMAQLVREGMRAGAIGFSTSQAATHNGAGGKPVPSRLASFGEVDALVGAMAESGRGIVQAAMGRSLFNEEFDELAERHGVPITWTALLSHLAGPDSHERYLEIAANQQAAGRTVIPQVACRPIMFDFTFAEPYPFELIASFEEVLGADTTTKREIYADPAFRQRFREESEPEAKNVNAGWARRTVISRCHVDPSLEERSLDDAAATRGADPIDLALDLSLESDFGARFRLAFLNHDEAAVERLITDPHTVVTLSDAGAHADQLCDSCYSTHLLGHWVREKNALDLEAAVHALTQHPAELMGITDRGVLDVGRPADVVVFDPDTVGASPLRRIADLPGGAERLVADAYGVHTVIVNGTVLRHDNRDRLTEADELPGRVLRSGRG